MDKQKIYDTVYAALIAQGVASIDPSSGGGCAYRGINGTKCAIGHLIPDELYAEIGEVIEGKGVNQLSEEIIERIFGTGVYGNTDAMDFLRKLQIAHDYNLDYVRKKSSDAAIARFTSYMNFVARSHNLKEPTE